MYLQVHSSCTRSDEIIISDIFELALISLPHAFCHLLIFFIVNFFERKKIRNTIRVSVSIQIRPAVLFRPNVLFGQIWVQTVCKGYQQATPVGKGLIMPLCEITWLWGLRTTRALISLRICVDWSVPLMFTCFVGNPEDRFCHDKAQLLSLQTKQQNYGQSFVLDQEEDGSVICADGRRTRGIIWNDTWEFILERNPSLVQFAENYSEWSIMSLSIWSFTQSHQNQNGTSC